MHIVRHVRTRWAGPAELVIDIEKLLKDFAQLQGGLTIKPTESVKPTVQLYLQNLLFYLHLRELLSSKTVSDTCCLVVRQRYATDTLYVSISSYKQSKPCQYHDCIV